VLKKNYKESWKFQRKMINRIKENRIRLIVKTCIRKLKREKRYATSN